MQLQALSKNEWDTPLAHTHFKAEGDVEFKAVLFMPGYAPPGELLVQHQMQLIWLGRLWRC